MEDWKKGKMKSKMERGRRGTECESNSERRGRRKIEGDEGYRKLIITHSILHTYT